MQERSFAERFAIPTLLLHRGAAMDFGICERMGVGRPISDSSGSSMSHLISTLRHRVASWVIGTKIVRCYETECFILEHK